MSNFMFLINDADSASYPDFTNIVEQNMPAVVIVNATRTVSSPNGQTTQTPPGMPDEFNDLFKNSSMKTKALKKSSKLRLRFHIIN